jgi:uncharacterized protein (UPF0332 family)
MTDKETLYSYRIKQAEETLSEAQKMLEENFSARSVINRAYYSTFYSVLALFVFAGLNPKTSKHAGAISLFDKEFIREGKIDKKYSQILHKIFEARQECDYKELVEPTNEDASETLVMAREFLIEIKEFTGK